MGFKVVINSRLSNLSKVTLLVNDRITIHFKSVSREVWREGHSWVLSVYTFLFFLLQENIFRKESGVFWLLQRRVFYTVFLDQPYPLQSMDSILSPKGHVRSRGEELNINPASSPISGVVPGGASDYDSFLYPASASGPRLVYHSSLHSCYCMAALTPSSLLEG